MASARHKRDASTAAGQELDVGELLHGPDSPGLARARARLLEAADHLPLSTQEMEQLHAEGTVLMQGMRVSVSPLDQFGIDSDYDAFLAVQLPDVRADDVAAMEMLLSCSIGSLLCTGCSFARDHDGNVITFQPVSLQQMDGRDLAARLLRMIAFSRVIGPQLAGRQ